MPVSTTSRLNDPRPSDSPVRATTTTRSALAPEVMNVLEPLTSHPPSTFRPVVRMPRRSLPAPGSVIAIAATSSPLHRPGSHRSAWSVVASETKYGIRMSSCSAKLEVSAAAPTRASSSCTMLRKR